MADEPEKSDGPVGEDASFNPVPVIFADTIANFAMVSGTFRAYLIRQDPAAAGETSGPSLVAQLIMPIAGFVGLAVVFEERLRDMINKKEVNQESVERLRETFRKAQAEQQKKLDAKKQPDTQKS